MKQKNTVDFGTIIWLILGLIIPLWPISLPLCWFMAYRSYASGGAVGSITDLASAHEMHKQGVLTDEEFEKIKKQALN